jgi:hypothetical protein
MRHLILYYTTLLISPEVAVMMADYPANNLKPQYGNLTMDIGSLTVLPNRLVVRFKRAGHYSLTQP